MDLKRCCACDGNGTEVQGLPCEVEKLREADARMRQSCADLGAELAKRDEVIEYLQEVCAKAFNIIILGNVKAAIVRVYDEQTYEALRAALSAALPR